MKITAKDINVPADVPNSMKTEYIKNYLNLTKHSGRLMMFAGDQKIEHLNSDFYGKGVHPDDADPEHLFRIASKAKIGVFASQLGTIARYGKDHKDVQYLVKLNSKTNLIKTKQRDPLSTALVDIDQVVRFKKQSGLKILGVGYTIYLGSEFEHIMFREVSQIINAAHQNGLIVILWMYPRGKAVTDEKNPDLIAGATGTALCLGADFVKVSYPKAKGKASKDAFKQAVAAAGRTKVVCAGGSSTDIKSFLKTLKDQLDVGAGGNATGRNVHQKRLSEAIATCNAIYALTVENKSVEDALNIYHIWSGKAR